jgi:hypothetical protein
VIRGRNFALIVGGWLSAAASLLHLGCIFGGADWYRFFGAGEEMARMAERGHWFPPVVTLGVAIILAIWAAYAFSGAGVIRRLPLLRTALVVITSIYLLRGLILFPTLAIQPERVSSFGIWSSLIVLGYGITYAIGTWGVWPKLSMKVDA